jgi:hypothetical protein
MRIDGETKKPQCDWNQMDLLQQIRSRRDSSKEQRKMVAQGYTQVEGLDFGETYVPVVRLEAIRILLAYACAHNIKLY